MKTPPFYAWGILHDSPFKNSYLYHQEDCWTTVVESIENANTFKTKLEAYVFKYIVCFRDDPLYGASLIKVTLDKDGNRLVFNYAK